VYCPKCGAVLSERLDEPFGCKFYCAPGETPFSARVERALIERFSEPDEISDGERQERVRSAPRLSLYCPGGGVPFDETGQCPDCGRDLRDLAYDLRKLHPHRLPDGSMW
jgi:hypothetical protein